MGCFSWCTSDTRKSIPCTEDVYEGAPSTVYLLNPFGEPYKESEYEGYGEFGGRDVFELVLEWNREYLSPANLRKPARDDYCSDKDGDKSYEAAVKLYEGKCEAIVAYANGASDEQMRNEYGQIVGALRDGSDWKRCLGIAITCYDEEHVKLHYPIKIVEELCEYDLADISPDCPFQGCFYDYSIEEIQARVHDAFVDLEAAQDEYMCSIIDALCDFGNKSHLDFVQVSAYGNGHIEVKDDEGNVWEDAEVYDFVLNECLGFEPDGKLQFGYGAISQELADTLKAHALSYGVKPLLPERSLDDRISNAEKRATGTDSKDSNVHEEISKE
ncbi:MAG: hypothetical protein IJZ42_13300 [Lachnospiraceae bacterium]|nr:hypothetical protein [Lachnospiraceae bacterium]